MDEIEIDEIFDRLVILIKVDFKKVSKVKNPDGRSWMDENILADFRDWCSVPDKVIIRLPRAEERPWDVPAGFFYIYECFFSWLGIRFPIPQFFFDYCKNHQSATSQLSHYVVWHMVYCAELAKAMHIPFVADFFERTSVLCAGLKRSDPYGVK